MVTKTKLIAGTAVFVSWGIFIALIVVGLLVTPSEKVGKMPTGALVAGPGGSAEQQGQQLAAQSLQVLTPAVVAQHSTVSDCWMIVDGKAYDLTAYLPTHPGGPGTMIPYCGKDATVAFATKDKGSPHSSYATALLAQYFIGDIGLSIPGGNPAPNAVQKKPSAKSNPVSPSLSLSPSASNPAPVAPPPVVPPPAAAPALTPTVVSQHSSASDCWMIIGSKVYDVTGYLPYHPAGSGVIVPYCGGDATVAFGGVGHSSNAQNLLQGYFVGDLVGVVPDSVAPVITVLGLNPATVAVGSVYVDAGVTSLDGVDGVLTSSIVKTGLPVSTVAAGVFVVSYSVRDAAGNTAAASRTVNVVPPVNNTPPVNQTNQTQNSTIPVFTVAQVAQHSTSGNCWMIIGSKVYDVTGYLPYHPAGSGVIVPYCGGDATVAFGGVGHSSNAQNLLQGYFVGELASATPPPPANQTNSTTPPSNSTGPKTYTVSVNSAGVFNQTSLAIRAGDTVRFYYTSSNNEVTISFSPSPPSSMTLDEERRSRSYTFTQAGSWVFRNSVSSSQGTISVQ